MVWTLQRSLGFQHANTFTLKLMQIQLWFCSSLLMFKTQNCFSKCTLRTRCLWSAMRRPGWLLAPPHAGGSSNPQKVYGVGLQVLQQMLGLLSWQLYLCYCTLWTGAIGQTVAGNSTTAQFQWKRLPRHLDVCGTAACEAELRGPEGNWEDQNFEWDVHLSSCITTDNNHKIIPLSCSSLWDKTRLLVSNNDKVAV